MKRIYLAGKLNSDAVEFLKNVSIMIKAAIKVQQAGYAVFVPALDLLMGIVDGGYTYQDYADNNMEWLRVSDAVLVLPGYEESKGTKAEIEEATKCGIPVIYSEGQNFAFEVERHFKKFPFMGQED
jgi:hypothetical protein